MVLKWEQKFMYINRELLACFQTENRAIWEPDEFIAFLLLEGILFTDSFWSRKDLPEDIQKQTVLYVNCNDIFAWGCADAEYIDYEEFDTLYAYYMKDPEWGPTVWCIKHRNMMPQEPVYDAIQSAGIWNLDTMRIGK